MLYSSVIFLHTLFAFLVGAVIGSFMNVVIDRLPRRESIAYGRSHCENCKKTLAWYDLIPLISFLALSGKCRYCKNKIPTRLFFVELVVGLVFTLLYLYVILSGLSFHYFIYAFLTFCLFFIIFMIDIKHGIIPDTVTGLLLIAVVLYTAIFLPDTLFERVIVGCISLAFFLFLFLITKGRGMGFGDVKLSFVLGFYLGFPSVIAGFYLSFLTGAFFSLILILWGKKKLRKDTIPFGPFLVMSSFVSFLAGEKIISLVLHVFGY